jgi:hypothetical protein
VDRKEKGGEKEGIADTERGGGREGGSTSKLFSVSISVRLPLIEKKGGGPATNGHVPSLAEIAKSFFVSAPMRARVQASLAGPIPGTLIKKRSQAIKEGFRTIQGMFPAEEFAWTDRMHPAMARDPAP